MKIDVKKMKLDLLLGALGALLMVVGDLSLSIIHSDNSDRGLYVREAYMNGSYQLWRPVLLFATGLIGMFFYSFGIKAMIDQIDPKCRKLRAVMKYGGLAYICTGAALHFFIGTLSYWMTVLSAEFGRETAIRLVDDYYSRFMPAASIAYPFIALLLLGSFISIVSNRTILPRKMLLFNILSWQLILVLVPDIHQMISPNITTMDYVMSQSSGNQAAVIMFVSQFIWLTRNEKKFEQ